jgi:hypothetical protein
MSTRVRASGNDVRAAASCALNFPIGVWSSVRNSGKNAARHSVINENREIHLVLGTRGRLAARGLRELRAAAKVKEENMRNYVVKRLKIDRLSLGRAQQPRTHQNGAVQALPVLEPKLHAYPCQDPQCIQVFTALQ